MRASLLICMLSHALVASFLSKPTLVDIFVPSARFPCFRQPGIVSGIDSNHLLAFAENRNVTECAPSRLGLSMPLEIGSLQLRRSSDGGHSWGPMQSLYTGKIDFYSIVRDAGNGTISIFLQDQIKNDVRVLSSIDGGETWDDTAFSLEGDVPPPFILSKPAVGHGIQLEASLCGTTPCQDVGRLLVPFVCMNSSAHGDADKNLADHSCIVYSDDHGATWRLGGIGQAGSREAQLVQTLSDGVSGYSSVYMTERNMGKNPGHRMWARSNDGGQSIHQTSIDKQLIEPVTPHWTGIVASVTRLHTCDTLSRIAYSGPVDASARKSMAIHLSYDEAHTWSQPKILWDGPSGYSDMVPLSSGSIGMILEMGNISFSDTVAFASVPLAWLEQSTQHLLV